MRLILLSDLLLYTTTMGITTKWHTAKQHFFRPSFVFCFFGESLLDSSMFSLPKHIMKNLLPCFSLHVPPWTK
ncbi:uncharacterized protein UV8b_04062 [Ustilaginoidea virens]|uniref:Secreted protein n=1 Tax=Ustilaginoidea virens TaxID=1159556 RepID=A0A8E5MHM2_USTVR|nr:uncharacterized protein UV8b_04062 [Ustilaginoidea virens]QUC19821.1 hypothetical protein UV8b_04062 [Ustilaginoidea virens]